MNGHGCITIADLNKLSSSDVTSYAFHLYGFTLEKEKFNIVMALPGLFNEKEEHVTCTFEIPNIKNYNFTGVNNVY